jgi:hypothetical protein
MIKPTIGRVVWYQPGQNYPGGPIQHGGAFDAPRPPCVALITYVWSDTLVNLVVFDHNSAMHARSSVELCQGETAPSEREYCAWMPYQKGQAAKTEELEHKLAAG